MPEKPKPVIKLSRKEEEVVNAYEENVLEHGKIHLDDPRDRIYHDIVVSKFGSYGITGERMTPTPLWDFVFDRGVCPACNTPVDMVRGDVAGTLGREGDSHVCKKCHFRISADLFEEAKERNARENEWAGKDAGLRKRMSKHRLGKRRIIKLAELGERKAMAKFERLLRHEKK